MEGARLRCSVALPRHVTKPTVIEDNGEKVTLEAGQEIICNLVGLLVSFLPFDIRILTDCAKYRLLQAATLLRSPIPTRSVLTVT
jgi:hypothetical protein